MAFDFTGLNEQQAKAVKKSEGPVLILAGAGSGKTRTLTTRIAYLIHEKGIDPRSILAVTFTNKAAREMKERIIEVAGDIRGLWIGTFHSTSARIMRREAQNLGYDSNFSIYDVDDQVRAIKKIISTLSVPQQQYTPKMIQNRLSKIKNQFLYPEDLYKIEDRHGLDEYLPSIYLSYQRFLHENNAMDFDDLLMKPLELFNKFPEIRKKYSDMFQYVLVDEYQDTNKTQYMLINKIVQDHHNLCVVGDEDQAIYGWRGADIGNIINFEKDYPEATVIKLEENYRSNKNILEAANAVVKNNTERIGKSLWTRKDGGSKISVLSGSNEGEEAARILEKIHDQVYTNKRSFRELAILYRTNVQSRVIEDTLRRNAISYNIVGGTKFYDRKEIKDILAYLKLIVNQSDSIALKRIVNFPLRGVGVTTVSKIEKFADMEQIRLFDAMGRVTDIAAISPAMCNRVTGFYELINKYVALYDELSASELASSLSTEANILHHYKTEYDQYEGESRVENINELFSSIDEFCQTREAEGRDNKLGAFLEEVSLMTDVDNWNNSANAVTLMTLHASKGLEFPIVFIAGLEMGLLPMQRNDAELGQLEEERRLMYVGMTRAEEQLYLTYSETRRRNNTFLTNMPSLFLDEIPQSLLVWESNKRGKHKAPATRTKQHTSKIKRYLTKPDENQSVNDGFKIGQKVYHSTFGKGQVRNLEGHGNKMKITVEFIDEGITKKLLREYANLSPLEE